MIFTDAYINLAAMDMSTQAYGLGGGISLSIGLFKNDIQPDAALQIGDIDPITGDGLSLKPMAAGNATLVWDDGIGVWGFKLQEPIGGLNFICASAPAEPPTAYGWFLTNTGDDTLIATGRFPEPITFTKPGDFAEVSAIVGWLAAPYIGDLPPS